MTLKADIRVSRAAQPMVPKIRCIQSLQVKRLTRPSRLTQLNRHGRAAVPALLKTALDEFPAGA